MDSREEGDPGTYPDAPVMPQLTGLGLCQCPGLTHAPVRPFSWLPSQQSESDSYSSGWGVCVWGRSAGNLISFPEVLTLTLCIYSPRKRQLQENGWGGDETQQPPLRWLDARASVLPICWTRSVLVLMRSQGP